MFAYPARCRPKSTLEYGARRACSRRAGVSFSSAFQSHVIMQSLIRLATFPCHYRPQTGCRSFADGSGGPFSRPARLRRARSPVRTSPLASGLPLTCEALPFAGAALPLTCRAAPANPSSFAALTTPGGLRSLRSASSLSFLVILLPQNNSLTFVRGADRAYRAPRKRRRGLTYAPRKWSWRPTKARLYQ